MLADAARVPFVSLWAEKVRRESAAGGHTHAVAYAILVREVRYRETLAAMVAPLIAR